MTSSHEKRPADEAKFKARRKLLQLGAGGLSLAAGGTWTAGYLLRSQDGQDFSGENGQFPDLVNYYPEILNRRLYENGDFQTPNRSVSWYNFSDQYSFNSDAASQMYSFLEDLGGKIPIFFVEVNGKSEAVLAKTKVPGDLKLFTVNKGMPKPKWVQGLETATRQSDAENVPALTRISAETSSSQLSDAEKYLFMTPLSSAESSVAIEASQASIHVGSGVYDYDIRLQEYLANTLGLAIAFRQQNVGYDSYVDKINVAGAGFLPSGIYRFDTLTREVYQALPVLPHVIKPRNS